MNLYFCGGAKEVGASCVLLRLDGKNILLDCGIRLTNKDALPDFRVIQDNGGVDAIIISHSHMDHVGSLPVISREYPNAHIYMSHASKDITRVLLYDSLKIMDKRESEIPVYAKDHVEEMLKRIVCFSFEYEFDLFKDIKAIFYQAGHILGASCVYIKGKEGSVFYSGDFSATLQNTIGKINIPKLRPDVMIMESTYGDKLHSNRNIEEDKLVEIVKKVTERGGKILIPAFAVGRAQEVILILKKAMKKKKLPKTTIYIDGMVKDICRMYKLNPNYLRKDLSKQVWKGIDIFYDELVKEVTSQEMRNEIATDDKPCCMIASSGMLTGGPSLFYAEQLIKDEKNFIAITGYQDEEAPGRKLLNILDSAKDAEKIFTVGDKKLPIKCEFGKYGLSAHADKGELLGTVQKLSPDKLFLVHGNPQIIQKLGIEAQFENKCETFIPKNGEMFEFDFKTPRKQAYSNSIKSLEKGNWIEKEDIVELWKYLKQKNKYNGYTLEELTYIWSGRSDFDESVINLLQHMLHNDKYFKQNRMKLFLYEPVEEKIDSIEEDFMEVNEMLSLVDRMFPAEAGIYKKGARHEEKVAILYFDFPSVSKEMYSEQIEEFEKLTRWTVELNENYNMQAVDSYINKVMESQSNLVLKTSYYQMNNLLKVKCSEKPSKIDEITKCFCKDTGLFLEFDYPEKVEDKQNNQHAIKGKSDILEQNITIDFIDKVFKDSEDKLYKKSIKNDSKGKFIELCFISPQIGQKYSDHMQEIAENTGWRITLSPVVNQTEIIKKAQLLLSDNNIAIKKNPGVLQTHVKVKLVEEPPKDIWSDLEKQFVKDTGFELTYIL